MIDNICSSELSGSVFHETQIRKAEEEKEILSTFKECSNQVEPILLKLGNEGKYISLVCAKLFNETTLPHVIRQSSRGRTRLLPRFFILSILLISFPSYALWRSTTPFSSNLHIGRSSPQHFGEWKYFLDVFFIFLPNSCLRMRATLLYSKATDHLRATPRFDGGGGCKIWMFSTYSIHARGKPEYVT